MRSFLLNLSRYKLLALGPVLVIAALGATLVALDILDIVEAFEVRLPLAVLNTVFVSAVAVAVAYLAARAFSSTGLPQLLFLGCGVVAFGAGSLVRSWLVGQGLNAPITATDSAALIASVLHLTGAGIGKLHLPRIESRRKIGIVLFSYLGILASIALITLLSLRGVLPPFHGPGQDSSLLRDIIRGTAAVFFLASSFIYVRLYAESQTDSVFWYSVGLMLFALGQVLIPLSPVEGQIAWLGRVSQYVGGVYFLVAIQGAGRLEGASRLSPPHRL